MRVVTKCFHKTLIQFHLNKKLSDHTTKYSYDIHYWKKFSDQTNFLGNTACISKIFKKIKEIFLIPYFFFTSVKITSNEVE